MRNFLGPERITLFSLTSVKYVVSYAFDGNEKARNGKVSISILGTFDVCELPISLTVKCQ